MNDIKDKMLIIDDHIQPIKKYSRLFSPDFLCLSASNGEEGLEVFERKKPDIVLCDVKMPGGISGFEVCRRIKSVSPEVIVILVSSYNSTSSRIEGYESRADDYIDKLMGEKEVFFKVKNFYYTKKNIPAIFPCKKSIQTKLIVSSFEENIRNIITNHYKKPLGSKHLKRISLNFISEEMGKSCRSIQREFSNKVSCTFSEFHNRVRLSIACNLLIESNNSVSDISENLCYASPSIFSREFKSMYGVTPSKYRSNNFL